MRYLVPLCGLAMCLAVIQPTAAGAQVVARAGLSAAAVHETNLTSDARRGLALGVGTRLRLSDDFSLRPEVWYLQKGLTSGTLWERINLETRYQTVSIPILLSLDLPATRFESRAVAGVAVDWVLNSEIRRADRGVWQEVTEQDESIYVSVVIGGGTRWRRLDLDVRYQHGVGRLTNYDYREFRDVIPLLHPFESAYDRTWILTAGYWF